MPFLLWAISFWFRHWKNLKNRPTFAKVTAKIKVAQFFFDSQCRSSLIRQLESLSDLFDGDQDHRNMSDVLKQATWCSAEETGRTVQRCLYACKNLLGLPYHKCWMREVVQCAASVENVASIHNRLQSRFNHKLNLFTILWHILQDYGRRDWRFRSHDSVLLLVIQTTCVYN